MAKSLKNIYGATNGLATQNKEMIAKVAAGLPKLDTSKN